MPRLQTLSADLDYPVAHEAAQRAPRAADEIDAPIGSPVHALQEQLRRFEAPLDDLEYSASARSDKAPGWVRLTLPMVLSMALWALMLRGAGVIG